MFLSVFRRWRHSLRENFRHLLTSWERLMESERMRDARCWVSIGWHPLSISLCYLKLGSISCDDSFPTDHCKKWERERERETLYVFVSFKIFAFYKHKAYWGLKRSYDGKLAFSCSIEIWCTIFDVLILKATDAKNRFFDSNGMRWWR